MGSDWGALRKKFSPGWQRVGAGLGLSLLYGSSWAG